MTSYRFFKMAAATAKYQFRFRTCWRHFLQKVKVYQQTKFLRYISIDGRDITTSVFEKQTSAILEIYFRFQFQSFAQNPHITLHQATEFRPNRSTQDGGRDGCILLPVSYLLMSLSRYRKLRLKYNYFRFPNTNVRHIGILLLISTSTSSP